MVWMWCFGIVVDCDVCEVRSRLYPVCGVGNSSCGSAAGSFPFGTSGVTFGDSFTIVFTPRGREDKMPVHVILFMPRIRSSFIASTKQIYRLCGRDNAASADATTTTLPLRMWRRRRCLCGRDDAASMDAAKMRRQETQKQSVVVTSTEATKSIPEAASLQIS